MADHERVVAEGLMRLIEEVRLLRQVNEEILVQMKRSSSLNERGRVAERLRERA